jgi:TonB family protein
MKHFVLIIFLMQVASNLLAQTDTTKNQTDTLFYRISMGFATSCLREDAEGVVLPDPFSPHSYTKKILFLNSQTSMVEYECHDTMKLSSKGEPYLSDVNNGKYEEWYLSGEKRVITFYTEDKLDGDFKVFYKNGKLKRSEKWKNGERTAGACFDEDGNSISYFPYMEFAEFKGGADALATFLGKEVKYPAASRKKNIEGVVYIGFIIDGDGSVINVKIKKGVEKRLNEEAIRAVKAMPNWNPAKYEGKKVKMNFTVPIRFRLD